MQHLSLESWRDFIQVPRGAQVEAVERWLQALGDEQVPEAWNARFGAGSLFDAWTRCSVVQGLYAANARHLRQVLDRGPGWRILEIGAGDGRLWQQVLRDTDEGELVVLDPMAEAHDVLRASLPKGVRLASVVAPAEQTLDSGAIWQDLDGAVCSLTLHHVAGRDAAERRRHGLVGPGKIEVLTRLRQSLRSGGNLLLNEADVHCEIDLPSGDPLLADHLIDSYVRRCAHALLVDVAEHPTASDDLRARWRSIVRHWCLEQVALARVPVAERDVYELDVARWLEVLDAAGFEVKERGFTDGYGLFHRYVAG